MPQKEHEEHGKAHQAEASIPSGPTLSVPETVTLGAQSVTVVGAGFDPATPCWLSVMDYPTKRVDLADDGSFSYSWDQSAFGGFNIAGPQRVRAFSSEIAESDDSNLLASTHFTVV